MNVNRRRFIASLLGTGTALGMSSMMSRVAMASVASDRYFVFAYFAGGWDVLMSLDPKADPQYTDAGLAAGRIDRSLLRSDDVDDNQLFADTGLRFDAMDFAGGKVTTCMAPIVSAFTTGSAAGLEDVGMSVVRGMTMDTLSHNTGRQRFITGQPPSGNSARGSSMATVLAALSNSTEPIPNLTAGVESYNVSYPQFATGLNAATVRDLLQTLRPADLSVAAEERQRIQALLEEYRDCAVAERSPAINKALDGRIAANALLGSGLDGRFDFGANTPEMAVIRDRFGFTANQLGGLEAQAAMAAQAIATRTSRVVSYRAAASLDTHFDNWRTAQFNNQYTGWRGLAALVDHLAATPHPTSGRSMMEHTTVLAFSEFSRTPTFNANNGRDHWLGNSALMLGKGIQTGIVGASSDEGMEPLVRDIGGVMEPIRPEHLHQAMLHDLGWPADTVDLRVAPLLDVLSNS